MKMQIKSVKLRFDKWKHSTTKAHLLVYRGKEVWLSRKLCRDFQTAGNDLHAWATIPAWLFKEITGVDADVVCQNEGVTALKQHYAAVIHTIVEVHVPQRQAPVASNTINELKKS